MLRTNENTPLDESAGQHEADGRVGDDAQVQESAGADGEKAIRSVINRRVAVGEEAADYTSKQGRDVTIVN